MDADAIVKAARDRLSEAIEFDEENRKEALEDLECLAGRNIWPEETRREREAENRPCYTVNKGPQFVRQVTGDIRRMNPAINVIPGDGDASADVAEIIEGLVRQIQYASDASSVYEHAAECAAQSSIGAFRILTDYEDGDTFDQCVKLEAIHNPMSVYFDPKARLSTRADGDWVALTDHMSKEDFDAEHPGKSAVDVEYDIETDGMEHWAKDGNVVVAEYMWKEYFEREIGLMADGTVVRDPKPPLNIIKTRKVRDHKVMWAKVNGKELLEGPQEMPTKYLPVVAVTGEEMHVGDEVIRTSVIRYAREPMQAHSFIRSAELEVVMLQPRAPYMVTAKQVAGYEDFWNDANHSNRPYLPYNADPAAGPPSRVPPPVASAGLAHLAQETDEDLKSTTGVYDAALGNRSNESSGVAIRQRQMESDVSTSIYSDNMGKAVAQAGRIIVDMIPRVYDTNRMIRILGKDDAESMVEINGLRVSQEGAEPVNPLNIGKYDVRVSVGPNYSTKRQEVAAGMMDFMKAFPPAAAVTSDLVAKNMDWPDAEMFAERLQKTLPPGVLGPEDMSPEQQAQMMQAQQAQSQAQQFDMMERQARVQKDLADAEKKQTEAAETSMDMAIKSGQMNEAIALIVQQEVARVLGAGTPAPQGAPMGPAPY